MITSDPLTWPVGLPTPLQLDRRHNFDPRNIPTLMESGRIRNRRIYVTPMERIEVQWNFTEDQYETFRAFFRDNLENGSLPFLLVTFDLSPEIGFISETQRELSFVEGKYSYSHDNSLYSVTATLEVSDTSVTSLEDPDFVAPKAKFSYPARLGTDNLYHVCRDTFKISFPAIIGKKYVVQIGEHEWGPWNDHVFYTALATGTKEMEFNNDYKGLLYFKVISRAGLVERTILSQDVPLASEIEPPSVSISNVYDSPHAMWSSGGFVFAYSMKENAFINPDGIYVVPRGRKEWSSGPTLNWVGTPNVLTITGMYGASHVYTRDGSDPTTETVMPKLDGYDRNVAAYRDDFGCQVKVRSFYGFCQSPVTMILVDKKVWSKPYIIMNGDASAVSAACDEVRTDQIRINWERDNTGAFTHGLENYDFESGDSCGVGSAVFEATAQASDNILTAAQARQPPNPFFPGPYQDYTYLTWYSQVSINGLGSIADYGTGEGGQHRSGFKRQFGSMSAFLTSDITFNRPTTKFDQFPPIYSNAYYSAFGSSGGVHVEDIYLVLGEGLGTAFGTGGSVVPLQVRLQGAFLPIAGEYFMQDTVTYDVYTMATRHNDLASPDSPTYVPPALPPPPPPPPPIPSYVDTFESYADSSNATIATLNDGTGWNGAWSVSDNPIPPQGIDNFESYTNETIYDGDLILKDGDGWVAGSSWSFTANADAPHYDSFQTYEDGSVTYLPDGDGWNGIWSIYTNATFTGSDDFQSYPAGAVTGTEGAGNGTDWTYLWSINDNPYTGYDDFESYSNGATTGAENGGSYWSSTWSFK